MLEILKWLGETMSQWMLKYLNLGWNVIPLKPKSKEPLIDWKKYQTQRITEQEIKEWWIQWPSANIGVVTGEVSNLLVVDADGVDGINNLSKLKLESPISALSGKGKHLYFKWTNGIKNSASKIAEGIDIRGEGGYVVAPPSIHPNGKRYRWLNVPTAEVLKNLKIYPIQYIVSDAEKSHKLTYPEKPDNWITEALEEMKNGHVHNTLVSVLGKFRHHNFSIGDTIALLKPHAFENGQPYEGLEAKVEEIWNRYEPKRSETRMERMGSTTSIIVHSPTNTESWTRYEERKKERFNNEERINTGFPKLDGMLQNGLKSSRLFTIAARTGTGKTNFIIGISRALCQESKRVLLFSTEMPYEEIWDRYIANTKDTNEFKQHDFHVCDSFAPNLEQFEEVLNQIKPEVFIFDHINHVSEDQRELSTFMQGLNLLKRKYDCAGIVTAQLNRSADWIDLKTGEKITPRMSMIKGSGTIEQASSRVLLLSETRVTPEMTEITGNLDKNDNGTKGLVHFGLLQNPWRIVEL